MNTKSGFAILYAILMVSIVLTISLSLLNITFKQIIFSVTGRDSKIAFYAADSALQCATYWDVYAVPNTDSPFGYFDLNGDFVQQNVSKQKVTCFGQAEKQLVVNLSNPKQQISSFDIAFNDGSFATIVVAKGVDNNNVTINSIEASGYNTSDQNSPRRLQRTLRAD